MLSTGVMLIYAIHYSHSAQWQNHREGIGVPTSTFSTATHEISYETSTQCMLKCCIGIYEDIRRHFV